MTMLAWMPFVDPLPGVQANWIWFVVPLVLGISMMYKAIRVGELSRWPREVAIMSGQVLLAFIGFAVGLFILVQLLLPMLPAN